ncbi:hypothetical protein JW992_12670, partial [candidate division KSB1 bacterium]|nr:hypothetical protein [candidate division KSB1 bacterium]
ARRIPFCWRAHDPLATEKSAQRLLSADPGKPGAKTWPQVCIFKIKLNSDPDQAIGIRFKKNRQARRLPVFLLEKTSHSAVFRI